MCYYPRVIYKSCQHPCIYGDVERTCREQSLYLDHKRAHPCNKAVTHPFRSIVAAGKCAKCFEKHGRVDEVLGQAKELLKLGHRNIDKLGDERIRAILSSTSGKPKLVMEAEEEPKTEEERMLKLLAPEDKYLVNKSNAENSDLYIPFLKKIKLQGTNIEEVLANLPSEDEVRAAAAAEAAASKEQENQAQVNQVHDNQEPGEEVIMEFGEVLLADEQVRPAN